MSTALSRQLRKQMSSAEARMWNLLRDEPFSAWHFRRQVQLGPYYADFGSHSARLVVEVDGDGHDLMADHDAAREGLIRAEGYRVVRVTNRDVMHNLEGVGALLAQALAASPTRPLRGHPPHKGEGDGRT